MLSVIFYFLVFSGLHADQKMGYFCVPVADLLSKPSSCRRDKTNYTIHAVSPETGQYACLRIHQGIFNERVTFIQELDDEIQVAITNCFYESAFFLKKQHHFWTHKDSIITDAELEAANISPKCFPRPLHFEKQHDFNDDDAITLFLPWYDQKTGLIYSVGTRFSRYEALDDTEHFGVVVYDSRKKKECYTTISKSVSTQNLQGLSFQARQKRFVYLLHLWATLSDDAPIAYVWGGVSWTHSSIKPFLLVNGECFGQPITFWIRPDLLPPCSGFDCSGLILRAAQIAELPYYFKNTTTISHHLRSLSLGEKLEEGDIIWCPGHVMVVSNVKENLMVEARSYSSGFGRVVETTVTERFERINTYDELIRACQNNALIQSKNQKEEKRYKLLKLCSLWQ